MSEREVSAIQFRDQLLEACRRTQDQGLCPFIDYEALFTAHDQNRGVITEEQAQWRVDYDVRRIGIACTGRLIDRGCWENPACPADPASMRLIPLSLRRRLSRSALAHS